MPEIDTTEPRHLRAGDTWKWQRTLPDYPATTWTLKYRFKHPTAAGFEISATSSGDDYAITVPAATTTTYAPGAWTWQSWVEGGTAEKYTVGAGQLTIEPDYRSGVTTNVLDDRSHARKTLAAIESWIESRNPGVESYKIAGREMRYIPMTDLLKMRQLYKVEVDSEDAAALLADGIAMPRRIQFRI